MKMDNGDFISREAALTALGERPLVWTDRDEYALGARNQYDRDVLAIQTIPANDSNVLECDEMRWIPVKTRPMTEEEREYWSEHYGYDVEYEDANMFDCPMPEDGQEVWVCYKSGYVAEDVCDNDDGMIGLEGNGDWDDVVAWMPRIRPKPWKGEE